MPTAEMSLYPPPPARRGIPCRPHNAGCTGASQCVC